MKCLKDYAVANPRKSIAVFALAAAMVSCYPVFFGMSFVSPVGLYYLYPYPPLVPDFIAEVVCEDFRQSDIGAAGYSMVPNTVVQWNALSWDLEFPFWTRYVGCGTPLFAQGQSMIGDILHWIPLAAGGSAVAWDIKFILSKAVFAAGVGLVVFKFTSSLPAGLLLAVSGCFLGFFAYRFNHPAFFVLTYAPWIVLQWARLGDTLAVVRPCIRSCVTQAVLLAAVTWLQLNAGAPKEGVITASFMHSLGMLAFVGSVCNKWGWVRSFAAAIGFSVGAIMVAAPHWLLFLDALAKSYTVYDDPVVDTYPLWSLVGFFDNFFFQQIDGTLLGPSTNIFVLLCMGSSLVGLRRIESIPFRGAWILFAVTLYVAFGLFPGSVLASIPFIRNIHHVGNTFSVPMMVFALILAGFGIREYTTAPQKREKLIAWSSLSVFFGLSVLYLVVNPEPGTFVFFMIVFAVTVLGLWGLHKIAGNNKLPKYVLTIAICCFVLLHVRHGMHLMTSTALDQYVTNPRPRADLSKESQAIIYLKQRLVKQGTPARIIGERQVMFPGYNSLLGFESLVSVEPLRNRQYERLLTLIDYPYAGHHWLRLIRNDQIPGRSPALDLLNVRYVLAVPGTPMPAGDMRLIHSSDLDVWERSTAWPRAFFVNQAFVIHEPTDIPAALYRFPHMPFAAVENRFVPPWALTETGTGYQVVPARHYSLTNNSTRFFVDATGPGLIVLGETYYPGDFVAKVNGEVVDCIRVNHAFKGIWVRKAGMYKVEFTYRPERLFQAMIVCVCGMLIMLAMCVASSKLAPTGAGENSATER